MLQFKKINSIGLKKLRILEKILEKLVSCFSSIKRQIFSLLYFVFVSLEDSAIEKMAREDFRNKKHRYKQSIHYKFTWSF